MTTKSGSQVLREIEELLHAEGQGMYTRWELFTAVLRRLDESNVEEVIAYLPSDVRERFLAWVGESCTADPAQGLDIGGEGVTPTPPEAFVAIRRWFAANRDRTSG